MLVKQFAKIILLAGALSLAACSSMHRYGSSGSDSAQKDGDEVETAGLGNGESVDGASGGEQSLAQKRTYYFDFDKSEIRESDKPAILANAGYLIEHPESKIILEGHTDPRGSREYNVALGERRANAVQDMLRSHGVPAKQIRVVSYGAERPAVAGHSEYAYQQDRRAMIVNEQG